MADLEKLTLEVETTAGESESALQAVTKNLKEVKAALDSVDTSSLKNLKDAFKGVKQAVDSSGIKQSVGEVKKQLSGLDAAKKALDIGKGLASGAWKGARGIIGGVATSMGKLSKAFDLGGIASNKFISSLIRIAGYRFVRAIISSVTQSASAGLENLARASSEANATLSQLSSGALTLQNSIGGALYSVLASIVGVLSTIISAAVSAINWISMLFAILGGRGTFKKATGATKEYGKALGGAAGGAKALKQELMGFDEINSLSPDTGGGGGGGGGGMLDYGSMFEETPVSESLKEMVDKADFTLLGESLANKVNNSLGKIDWSKIQTGAYKFANSLVTFINGFIGKINANVIGDTIAGLVNTGITFINRIGYGIGWRLMGTKLKLAILRAVSKISPQALGLAIVARINAGIEFLRGAIPETPEEWSEITTWIAESINAAINGINKETLGSLIGDVIVGGVQLITDLAEAGTLTNITSAISTAIEKAIENIDEEQLRAAIEALLKDAWKAVKVLINLAVEIGDTAIGKALTGYALYRILAPALQAAGVSGYHSTAKGMALAGSVMLMLDAAAGIKNIKHDIDAGNAVSIDDVVDVISSAFKAAGMGLFVISPMAGGVLIGIGFGIELLNSFVDLNAAFSEVGKVVGGAVGVTAVEGLNRLEEATESVVLSEQQLARVAEYTNGILENGGVTLPNLAIAFAGLIDEPEILAAVLKNLGVTADTTAKSVSEFIASIETPPEVDVSGATEAIEEVKTAATEVSNAFDGLPTVMDVPKVDSGASSGIESLNSTLQATGTHAEELNTKIISIPSDIVFNLTLNNYDAVMNSFDTLKTTADEIATSMSGSFTSINWFGIGSQIATAFSRGIKSVRMPKMSVSWTTSSKTASILGKSVSISIPTPSIKMYAKGGFPDTGELFMANENGRQEMIGRIGNKPAVANQDQIGDAIFKYMDAHNEANGGGMDYGAMASALVGAMKSAGLGALYLDGKMIKNSLNKEAQRSGKPVLNY